MPLTPETLTRHELVGLPVRVATADNPDLVGIAGRVVFETMQTLRVDCAADLPSAVDFGEVRSASHADRQGSRVCSGERQVPKTGTTFEFALSTETGRDVDTASRPTDRGVDTAPRPTDRGDKQATSPPRTDEAAAVRKAAGSTSELGSETAGVRPGQSGPSPEESGASPVSGDSPDRGECEGVVYVTVDGVNLLSRPATRTERAGDSTWH